MRSLRYLSSCLRTFKAKTALVPGFSCNHPSNFGLTHLRALSKKGLWEHGNRVTIDGTWERFEHLARTR